MSEEKRLNPESDDPSYHPYFKQLSKGMQTSKGAAWAKKILWTMATAGLIAGWLYLVFREPPKLQKSLVDGLEVQVPAPEDILNNPEFQRAIQMGEEQMELDRIAMRFVEVQDYHWKQVGWKVQRIREISTGLSLGKDVEDFRDVYGTVMETRVSKDDSNGLWDIGIQYARLLGLDVKDPQNQQKVALIAAYVNNENLLIEYERYTNREYNPHLVPPGSLVRFRPLDDSLLEVLFTDWHQVIDKPS